MTSTTCPAPHHGECDATLSARITVDTLAAHGYQVRVDHITGTVQAWEEATLIPRDGGPVQDASGWVSVPRDVHALAVWLGY